MSTATPPAGTPDYAGILEQSAAAQAAMLQFQADKQEQDIANKAESSGLKSLDSLSQSAL